MVNRIPDPRDEEFRLARLKIDNRTVGYLRARNIEWLPRRKASFMGVDLDVALVSGDNSVIKIDFAIPDGESFFEQAGSGKIDLNDVTYEIDWVNLAEGRSILSKYFYED